MKVLLLMGVMLLVFNFQLPLVQAALTVGFFDNGTATSKNVDVGVPFDLPVYLVESNPDTILSTHGLVSMGLKATFVPTQLSVISIDVNPLFNFLPTAQFNNALGTLDFNSGTLAPVSGASILLATIRVKADAQALSTFVFGHTFSGFDEFVSANSVKLDSAIFDPGLAKQYTATIDSLSAIPEVSSLSMVALVFVSCAASARRRRTNRLA